MIQVLDRLSVGDSSVSKSARGLARVMLFNYWLTYSVLKAKRPKFQHMHSPVITEVEEEQEEDKPKEKPAQSSYNGNGVH